ncbi:MAG TPA: biosynthetic peptidoglycan transglycosylase, partial [Ktedonobacteraceae bacterium]|nr:biosynthetic peptidoglycan transglycosylase [Ktedonobacteraceae bacterium]
MDNHDEQPNDETQKEFPMPADTRDLNNHNHAEPMPNEELTLIQDVSHSPTSSPTLPIQPLSPASTRLRKQLGRKRSPRSPLNRRLVHDRLKRRFKLHKKALSRAMNILAIVFAAFFILLSGSLGASYAYYQAQLPTLNSIANHTTFQTTHIYDRNGKLLYQINDPNEGRRTYVNYTDISENLINATVAAEDHTFWTNGGVDFQGILRAALADAQSHQQIEGASTITQQLIKRQLFPNDPRT